MKAPKFTLAQVFAKAQVPALSPLKSGKEFFQLLSKSRKESLSEAEQERLHLYQQDMIRLIPLLILFLLPGSFITLPLLFMVVPKDRLLPRQV